MTAKRNIIPCLHWAFDYRVEEFSQALRALLNFTQQPGALTTPETSVQWQYTVLRNFWRSHTRLKTDDPKGFGYGALALTRTSATPALYRYDVHFTHQISGEDLSLSYQTTRTPSRALSGTWSSRTQNHAKDLYTGLSMTGQCVEQGDRQAIELCINEKLTMTSETLAAGQELGCHWSLFDSLSDLAAGTLPAALHLLDDMEKLKPACHLTVLEETTIDLEETSLALRGFVLHGQAEVPSTWWLNEQGRVVVMSNILNTFVLEGVRHV